MKPPTVLRSCVFATATALILGTNPNACAQSSTELSEGSLVPVAVSAALPVILVAGVGAVVVTGVEASARGTAWIVEAVADGAKGSICFTGQALDAAAMAVGTVLVVTVVATGMVLSAAGHVVAFVPNEAGRTLSYNRRVSR